MRFGAEDDPVRDKVTNMLKRWMLRRTKMCEERGHLFVGYARTRSHNDSSPNNPDVMRPATLSSSTVQFVFNIT